MKRGKVGAGMLFQDTAKSIFVRISGQAYDNMLARAMRKGYPRLPFDKEALRAKLLSVMDGQYDGYFRCRYCTGYFSIEQISIDHALPLSRGGGAELDNLDFPCRGCNDIKGGMTPEEYLLLLEFLNTKIPLAKNDVIHRLRIAVKLAAGDSYRKKKNANAAQGRLL